MMYDEKTAVERIKGCFYKRDEEGNDVLRIRDDSMVLPLIKLSDQLDEEIATVVQHLYELDAIVGVLESAVNSYVYNSEYLDEEPDNSYRQSRVRDAQYQISGAIQLIKNRK